MVDEDGYAGHGDSKNKTADQDKVSKGPLPQGDYDIRAPYYHNEHTGDKTLDLIPWVDNDMFGRKLFRIHGDSRKHPGDASEGCIVVPPSARDTISKLGGGTLAVNP